MPVAIRSHFIRRFVGAILLGGLFAVALGCGGGDTKMVPVSGKVTVNGKAHDAPYLSESMALHGGRLHERLSTTADPAWGSRPDAAPPSFAPAR